MFDSKGPGFESDLPPSKILDFFSLIFLVDDTVSKTIVDTSQYQEKFHHDLREPGVSGITWEIIFLSNKIQFLKRRHSKVVNALVS